MTLQNSINLNSVAPAQPLYGYRPVVSVSGNKTIASTDLNTLQVCSASAAITIPSDANGGSTFTSGNPEFEVFINTAGAVTIVPGAGTTIVYRNASGIASTGTVTSAGQYSFLFAKKIAANTWAIGGGTV